MADARPSVVFVGESPPPGAPPGFVPFDCTSGDRLAKLALGLRFRGDLLAHVERVNIFDVPGMGAQGGPKWDADAARDVADTICRSRRGSNSDRTTIVALGRDVGEAFVAGGKRMPWGTWIRLDDVDVVFTPHPSGRASVLNTTDARISARRYLLPELVAGCRGLRPWHFDLSDHGILADLGAAVSPFDPALGIAALRIADEVWRSPVAPRGWTRQEFGDAVNVSLLELSNACTRGVSSTATILSYVGIRLPRIETDLRSRSKAAASLVAGYPVEVLRATVGRYVALGVL